MATWVALTGVVGVVLLATAVAVATERWARVRGLELARRRLAAELATDRVQLAVPARPLVPALLRASGTEAVVTAQDVPVGDDGRLRELTATLEAVRVRWRGGALDTGAGTFEASIDEGELGRLVRLPGVVSRLELRSSGLRVWTVLGVAVDADVLVHAGRLRVIPDPAQVARLLELPGLGAFRRAIAGVGLLLELLPLPLDAIVESVDFDDGRVRVTGRIAAQHLAPTQRHAR